jgi:hypothetical protein
VPSKSRVKDGLCSTCDHAPICCYLRSRRGPVFYCEEFSAHTPPEVRNRKPSRSIVAEGTSKATTTRPNGMLGLCSTCDFWETCMLAGCEGGIWHCEEYQ